MERESFKEFSEAAIVKKKRPLSDEVLLRVTSNVFIDAGQYLFFASQNQGSGVSKNFQAAEAPHGKKNYIFRWEFMLTFSLCSR